MLTEDVQQKEAPSVGRYWLGCYTQVKCPHKLWGHHFLVIYCYGGEVNWNTGQWPINQFIRNPKTWLGH